MYTGNSVKTTVLSANSEFVPELAMIRFDQENGRSSGKLVRIPPAESMSGIEITVSNRRSETGSSTKTLEARLGSPQGEREKGEVHVERAEIARKERVEKELQSARIRQEARTSAPRQPLKVIDERTKDRLEHSLDSSFEKKEPVKKKKKVQVQETSSSSETSTSDISTDDDGEPVTKNLVRLQSLRVEVEVAKLARLKKKFRKVKKLSKKTKKSARTKSGD
jgi:hypothetical protein